MAKKEESSKKGKHASVKRWELYKIKDGKLAIDNKICPKCGKFLAKAEDRYFCGGCKYTVFNKQQ